ncbi:unnamed protein product [Lactuca saligna]|uniref:SAM domain-containing protein n=1 Tax=Lactuca saligna TaxID=75948 RepID=A0AA35YFN0_LACSI|nr:unnamed protein product [Lactuca saligna]
MRLTSSLSFVTLLLHLHHNDVLSKCTLGKDELLIMNLKSSYLFLGEITVLMVGLGQKASFITNARPPLPSAFLLPTPSTPATTTSSTALRYRRPSPTLTLRQRQPSIGFHENGKIKAEATSKRLRGMCTRRLGGSPLQPIAIQEVDDHIAPSQPDPPMPLPLVNTKPITTLSSPRKLMNHRGKLVNSHYKIPKPRKYCGNLVNGHMLVNTKMRALNLERKLKRAGGLNSWLVSLGLGQFVKIFRCKRVGKMQLVNLTMKKLKDMGAVAVGPRRKLMHAIDCLW